MKILFLSYAYKLNIFSLFYIMYQKNYVILTLNTNLINTKLSYHLIIILIYYLAPT